MHIRSLGGRVSVSFLQQIFLLRLRIQDVLLMENAGGLLQGELS